MSKADNTLMTNGLEPIVDAIANYMVPVLNQFRISLT
jgi:hypothetical protein